MVFNPNLESNAVFLTALGGILFIGLRSLGKVLGALFGGKLARADPITYKWMGVALLPQAGVAIGMALVAGNYFQEHAQLLLSVVIGSTVFFEIIGPVFTRMALRKAEME